MQNAVYIINKNNIIIDTNCIIYHDIYLIM